MAARYMVNQLNITTWSQPEAQEAFIAEYDIAAWSEFYAAAIFDGEQGQTLMSGCWIGVANGGDYEWAELELLSDASDRTAQVGDAIETYLNDLERFAAAK